MYQQSQFRSWNLFLFTTVLTLFSANLYAAANDSLESDYKQLLKSINSAAEEMSKALEETSSVINDAAGTIYRNTGKMKMYSENDQSEKIVTAVFSSDKIEVIHVDSSYMHVKLSDSTDSDIHVRIQILVDPTQKSQLKVLEEGIELNLTDTTKSLDINKNLSQYICIYNHSVEGLSITGGCYASVDIALPQKSDITVFGGKKILRQSSRGINLQQLKLSIEDAFSSEQFEMISTFANNKEVGSITANELIEVIELINLNSDKMKAFKRLLKLVSKEQIPNIVDQLDDIFVLSSYRQEALSYILKN